MKYTVTISALLCLLIYGYITHRSVVKEMEEVIILQSTNDSLELEINGTLYRNGWIDGANSRMNDGWKTKEEGMRFMREDSLEVINKLK